MQLKALLLAAALSFSALGAAYAAYPDHSIRLIVPFAPGGNGDTYARLVAENAARKLGQTIIVENKAGAGGIVATDYVAKSAADGYTLLWATSGGVSTAPAVLGPTLPYSVPDDFSFIAMAIQAPHGLFVSGKSTLELKDIIEQSKDKEFSYGSTGLGGASHVGMELLKKIAGINALHIPYRGAGPAVTDMLGGRIDMLYTSAPAFSNQVNEGVLRLLAVTGDRRIPSMPNVPTFHELGINAELLNWSGVLAPANLAPDVQQKLVDTFSEALKDPSVRDTIERDGGTVPEYTGQSFEAFVVKDIERYTDVLPEEEISSLRSNK